MISSDYSLTYIKTVIVVTSPMALVLLFFLIFLLIKLMRRSIQFKHIRDWLILSIVVIVYFTHPTIAKYVINKFFCLELD